MFFFIIFYESLNLNNKLTLNLKKFNLYETIHLNISTCIDIENKNYLVRILISWHFEIQVFLLDI